MRFAKATATVAAMAAIFFCACVWAGEGKDRVPETLAEFRIENGEIASIEYCETKLVYGLTGDASARTFRLRVVVKARLSPVKGSNINVEVWPPRPWQMERTPCWSWQRGSRGTDQLRDPRRTACRRLCRRNHGHGDCSKRRVRKREPGGLEGFRVPRHSSHDGCSRNSLLTHTTAGGPDYSYFFGGSTGGQQALQEAQRYPEDYDGIVAGVPGHCRTPLHAYFLWNDQILRKCPFSVSQQDTVVAAANEYMASREIPQTAGKLISDPRCSQADIEAVIALARKKDPTLTDSHAEALRKLFDGPKHAVTGERIFCGIPLGGSFAIAHGHLYLFTWVFGPEKDLMEVDFGKDIDTYTAALGPYLNAENSDLSRFEQRGGKLIMYSGSADSCVPYHATLDYYERVIEHFGSVEKVGAFFKYYIIPGMSHGPGPGINSIPNLSAMVMDWREKGIEPGMLSGKRVVNGKVELEISIYPYPAKTGWDAETGFKPVAGPRGGVDRIAVRFRPDAAE